MNYRLLTFREWTVALIWAVSVLCLPWVCSGIAQVQEHVYQVFDAPSASGTLIDTEVGRNLRLAQAFDSGGDYELLAIEFYIYKRPPSVGGISPPIAVKLSTATRGGAPTDTILATGTIDAGSIQLTPNWIRWDLRSFGLRMQRGNSYAIQFGDLFSSTIVWPGAQGNQYSAGASYSSSFVPPFQYSQWGISAGGLDHGFRIIGSPPPVPPSITLQPRSQSVPEGQSVTLSVTATGDAPLDYQWEKDGVTIAGATGATLSLTNLRTAGSGAYRVLVSNAAGSVSSQIAILTIVPLNSRSTRSLPQAFLNGVPLTIEIEVKPDPNVTTYTVSERFPSDWTLGAINSLGRFDAASGEIKWGPFSDAQPRSFKYEVTPSLNSPPVVKFAGTSSFDGLSASIGGDTISSQSLAVSPWILTAPQAKTVTSGGSVTFCVTAAGTSPLSYKWKKGQTDILGATTSCLTLPNVQTREAGEYSVEIRNLAGSVISQPATLDVLSLGSQATRNLPATYQLGTPLAVSILIEPDNSVVAHAVEDQVPEDWVIGFIDNGGVFDSRNRKVKWGIFFDNQSRTLTYRITPGVSSSGSANFIGRASFDGSSIVVGGSGATTSPNVSLPQIGIQRLGDDVVLTFSGGRLFVGDTVQGRYDLMIGVQSPYRVPTSNKTRFYMIR